jgi:hypothetical protein
MRRVLIGLLVAACTFLVGYFAVRLVNSYADTVVDAFYPGPSASPSPTDLSEFAKLPVIHYCDLVRDTTNRFEQIVRVRGSYYSDMENSALGDEACGQNIWTWVETERHTNFARALSNLRWGDEAEVVFLGRLTGPTKKGIGHLDGYRYRLVVLKVEDVRVTHVAEQLKRKVVR